MKDDCVALWLEAIAHDEPMPEQPSRQAIGRWLDARAAEQLLAITGMAGWLAIAADEDLECRCGTESYTDCEPCPRCWAVEMFEMHRQVLTPERKSPLCKKSEPRSEAADSVES